MTRKDRISLAILGLPLALLALVFAVAEAYIAAFIAVLPALALVGARWCVPFSIACGVVAWVCVAFLFVWAIGILLPLWAAGLLLTGLTATVYALALRLHQRIRSNLPSRRTIVEWEWVFTGQTFATNHPLSKDLGGIWWVLGFLVFIAGVTIWSLWIGVPGLRVLQYFALAVVFLAIPTLLFRHPSAYPLTWVLLILTFPISLPFIVYWADGVRPNLIYRYRFERLVRPIQSPANSVRA